MRSENEQSNSLDSNELRELRILNEVVVAPNTTQRQLSQKVGVALG